MRTVKFRYITKHLQSGNIEVKHYSLNQIEVRPLKELSPAFLSDYILLARNEFTGLKDENGNDIYEGDILKVYEVSNYSDQEYISPVEYIESGFLVTEPNNTQVPLACFHNLESTYPLFEIEIIGNIYGNPGLVQS